MGNEVILSGTFRGQSENIKQFQSFMKSFDLLTSDELEKIASPKGKIEAAPDVNESAIESRFENRMELSLSFSLANGGRLSGVSVWRFPVEELEFLSEKFQLEIECCCVETGQEFCGKVSYSNGELIQTDYYKDTLCLAGVFYLFGLDGLADHYILCTYAPPRLNDTYISLEKSIKEWNSRYHDIPLVCPTNAQIAAFICVREVEAYRYDGKEIQKLSLMTSR